MLIIWLAMSVALASIEALFVRFLLNHLFTADLIAVAFGPAGVTFWKALIIVVLAKLFMSNFRIKTYNEIQAEKEEGQ